MKPATPLPWEWSDTKKVSSDGELPYVPPCAYIGDTMITLADTYEGSRQDCFYLQHACNAYPRLISMLTRIGADTTSKKMHEVTALLRELGELT